MLLMPPSLGEWLPEDHLVWTVLGAVDLMDLGRFTEGVWLGLRGARHMTRRCWWLFLFVRVRTRESVVAGD